jgi:hypothetical protein
VFVEYYLTGVRALADGSSRSGGRKLGAGVVVAQNRPHEPGGARWPGHPPRWRWSPDKATTLRPFRLGSGAAACQSRHRWVRSYILRETVDEHHPKDE